MRCSRSSCPPAVCSRSCAVRWPAAKRAAHSWTANLTLYWSTRPLPDEFGHELAQLAAGETTAGVILLAKAEIADSVAEKVEDDGVFVVPKPLSRVLFMQALRMTRAARSRLSGLQNENRRLQKRIEDIRLVDRAKCLLIECCGMSEPEAHSYIEQQAMNRRCPKRDIAQGIIDGDTP